MLVTLTFMRIKIYIPICIIEKCINGNENAFPLTNDEYLRHHTNLAICYSLKKIPKS